MDMKEASSTGDIPVFSFEPCSPLIALLTSDGADFVLEKNGLDFAELLVPFSTTRISIKDPFGCLNNRKLHLDFRDIRKCGFLLSHTVLPFVLEESILSFENQYKQPVNDFVFDSPTTSFYDAFMHWLEPTDHESFRYYLACIFVVSSQEPDPLRELERIEAEHHKHQHWHTEYPSGGTSGRLFPAHCSTPRWFMPNILKYYVLVHDKSSPIQDSQSSVQELFERMCKNYGSSLCAILPLNSASPPNDETRRLPFPDPWTSTAKKYSAGLQLGLYLARQSLITRPSASFMQDDDQQSLGDIQSNNINSNFDPLHFLARNDNKFVNGASLPFSSASPANGVFTISPPTTYNPLRPTSSNFPHSASALNISLSQLNIAGGEKNLSSIIHPHSPNGFLMSPPEQHMRSSLLSPFDDPEFTSASNNKIENIVFSNFACSAPSETQFYPPSSPNFSLQNNDNNSSSNLNVAKNSLSPLTHEADESSNFIGNNGTSDNATDIVICGQWLDEGDRDRIRRFIEDFVHGALVPFVERQLVDQNEVLMGRKGAGIGKSFTSVRRWLGTALAATAASMPSSSPDLSFTAAQNSYGPESVERQMRSLADLAFQFGLYSFALPIYQSLKTDFINEQSWLYAAGALEMVSIASLLTAEQLQQSSSSTSNTKFKDLLSSPAKRQNLTIPQLSALLKHFNVRYMDDAINYYSNACGQPLLALRSALLFSAALEHLQQFNDAALQLVRASSEICHSHKLPDFFNAVLLEKAALLFGLGNRRRRMAFYSTLAANYFARIPFNDERRWSHIIRCCSRAKSSLKGWNHAEAFIESLLSNPNNADNKPS